MADQAALLRQAREDIAAARLLLEHGYARIAALRAYFAMFYTGQPIRWSEFAPAASPDPTGVL